MTENEIKQRAKEILSKMSFEDKIGQVTQVPFDADNIEESCEMIRKMRPGSIILCWSALGGQEEQRRVCISALNELQKTAVTETPSKIPILFGRDVIHGHHIGFPVPLTMAQSLDFDLIKESYDAIRQEAICDGIKWTFAPMLDMSREPRWGRIVEGPGEDPYIGARFARACVEGFQTDDYSSDTSMLACAKHYVGYGASEGGRDYNHTEISDYNLQNNYLPAFREAVNAGLATVMSAFNDINGIPATGSRKILTDILRDQLGFKGFVVSDWDAIRQMSDYSGFCENRADSARTALKAGVDMDMVCNCYYENIRDLIDSGELDESDLDLAVTRIVETKLRFGLFENPYAKERTYDKEKHLELSKKLAEESIVLLKNENNILPLSKESTIGICGNFLNEGVELIGAWSLDYNKSLIKTVKEALLEAAPKLETYDVSDGCNYRFSVRNGIECNIAVIGEKKAVTGEAAALADISIPSSQLEMVRKLKCDGKPVIGIFCFARPIALGEAEKLFDAILWCGHGGTRAGDAIASVLFGDAEPQGRLPFTLPYSVGQLPLYYNALPGSRRMNGYYGDVIPAHGNYNDCTGAPAFPFGFGLSYTSFKISDFSCDKTEISMADLKNGGSLMIDFKVKNTGNRKGVCVPELYIRDLVGSRIRPLRSLVRLCKVSLGQNEEKTLHFDIRLPEFGFYLESGEFTVERGLFDIYLGENCLTDNKITVKLIS